MSVSRGSFYSKMNFKAITAATDLFLNIRALLKSRDLRVICAGPANNIRVNPKQNHVFNY